MSKYLSKSQFTRGLQCTKSLWLYRNQKELQDKPDAMTQMIFDQGHEIGEIAQKRYPGGVLISEDHLHPDEAVASTEKAVAEGATILYEAAAIHDGTLVRADILVKREGGLWDLVEVKSSTSVKDYHIDDMAVQKHVLEGAGYKLGNVFLLHVNKEYKRSGEIDLEQFFSVEDVAERVKVASAGLPEVLIGMQEIVKQKAVPDVGIGARCDKPNPCDFKKTCWKDVPEDSVFKIGGLRKNIAEGLWNQGIKRIAQVPTGTKMSAKQAMQVELTKAGNTLINVEAIRLHLEKLSYPLHFLDFEAVAPGIPAHDGMRPFQVLPFQASIHTLASRDGVLLHHEFLADPDKDPRTPLAEFICEVIKHGSVIAYNASYEGQCLKTLAGGLPPLVTAMDDIKQKLWDLANPFRSGHYMKPEFNGSWSLKKILPVLVPSMDYKGLEIGQGGDAAAVYWDAMQGKLTGEEREKVFAALIEYCAQDTLGMVEILRHLWEITEGKTVESLKA